MFVCVCLSPGACVYGHDESTDDHSSADAADPVPPSAPGSAAATTGSYATAGKNTHLHFTQCMVKMWPKGPKKLLDCL